MPILKFSFSEVENSQTALAHTAQQIAEEVYRLRNSARVIDASWSGLASEQFLADFYYEIQKLQRLGEDAEDMVYKLKQEIEKWELTDNFRFF